MQPVQLSAELNAAADTHARDMSVQKRAWHFGSDLTSPRERAFRAGYRGEIVGENLSEGSDSDLTVLASWLDFTDTRGVILDPGRAASASAGIRTPPARSGGSAARGVAGRRSGAVLGLAQARMVIGIPVGTIDQNLLDLGVADGDAAGGPVLLAAVGGAARAAVDEDVAARPHAHRPGAGDVEALG